MRSGMRPALECGIEQALDFDHIGLRDQTANFAFAAQQNKGGLIRHLEFPGDGCVPVCVPVYIDEGNFIIVGVIGSS